MKLKARVKTGRPIKRSQAEIRGSDQGFRSGGGKNWIRDIC